MSKPTTSQLVYLGITEFLNRKMNSHNQKIQEVVNPKTAFTGEYPVDVSPGAYLKCLLKSFETSPGVMVMTLIYVERLLAGIENEYKAAGGQDTILFTSFNAHRMILTTFLVAQKYCEDRNYRLESIARVGGVSKEELIFLEKEFLNFIDYQLYVDEDTFNEYSQSIVIFSSYL